MMMMMIILRIQVVVNKSVVLYLRSEVRSRGFDSLMRDAVEMSAEFRVFWDDVVVADVDENVQPQRLEIGCVFPPARIVELKTVAKAFFLVRNVENFDAIIFGKNSTLNLVVVVIIIVVIVVIGHVTVRRCKETKVKTERYDGPFLDLQMAKFQIPSLNTPIHIHVDQI